MRLCISAILILSASLLNAQTSRSHRLKRPSKPSVRDFFSARDVCIDSVHNLYLYYKVYDWAGTKYKYAGNDKKGIDCSGFVSKMYNDAYCIQLPGGSKDIWQIVSPVEKECLEEGDLVFFKIKKGQISHIGIYLGNNKFAHASVRSGVMVSDLDEAYYKKYFFKGGRIPQ